MRSFLIALFVVVVVLPNAASFVLGAAVGAAWRGSADRLLVGLDALQRRMRERKAAA